MYTEFGGKTHKTRLIHTANTTKIWGTFVLWAKWRWLWAYREWCQHHGSDGFIHHVHIIKITPIFTGSFCVSRAVAMLSWSTASKEWTMNIQVCVFVLVCMLEGLGGGGGGGRECVFVWHLCTYVYVWENVYLLLLHMPANCGSKWWDSLSLSLPPPLLTFSPSACLLLLFLWVLVLRTCLRIIIKTFCSLSLCPPTSPHSSPYATVGKDCTCRHINLFILICRKQEQNRLQHRNKDRTVLRGNGPVPSSAAMFSHTEFICPGILKTKPDSFCTRGSHCIILLASISALSRETELLKYYTCTQIAYIWFKSATPFSSHFPLPNLSVISSLCFYSPSNLSL